MWRKRQDGSVVAGRKDGMVASSGNAWSTAGCVRLSEQLSTSICRRAILRMGRGQSIERPSENGPNGAVVCRLRNSAEEKYPTSSSGFTIKRWSKEGPIL